MRQKLLAGLVVLGILAGAASPARADFNIATGLRWMPLRYTVPQAPTVDTVDANGVGTAAPTFHTLPWNSTSLDTYIAFFIIEQVGIMLSVDLGYLSYKIDNSQTPQVPVNDLRDGSFFQFGFGIGGKFYLNRPAATRVSPYLFVDFYKYFASMGQNRNPGVAEATISRAQGLASPLGFNLAFGAEYFFTTSFSIGAEVLGLRYGYRSGTAVISQDGATQTERFNQLTLYTGISLNYRFLASASVKSYEDEEDRRNPRRPTTRPKPRPRPSEYDEESPESVD